MSLVSNLKQLGLSEKEAVVYSTLAKLGWATVLQISRRCEVKRSTIHRVVEDLRKKGLVEMQVGDKTSYYQVTNTDVFVTTIKQQEQQLQKSKIALKNLRAQIKLISNQTNTTQVIFHRGIRGIQVLETKISKISNQTLYFFESGKWSQVVGVDFAEDIRQKYLEHNLKVLELTNQNQPVVLNNGRPTTTWTKNSDYVQKCWRHRVVNPTTLTITNDIYVLPQSVVFYTLMGDEIVGIEVGSPTHTTLMKQLFFLTWSQAKVVDQFGQIDW